MVNKKDNKVKCMCTFSLDELLANSENTLLIQLLTEKCGIELNDIIMTIWFNENVVDIFNLDYVIVKYIPVFIVDFDLTLENIVKIYDELNLYFRWYEKTTGQELVSPNDKNFYSLCKSMCEEIKKQWL